MEINKNFILDLILLDEYTKNIEYWNPFDEYKDINFFYWKIKLLYFSIFKQ